MKTKNNPRNLTCVVAGAVLGLLAVSFVLLPGSVAARTKKLSYPKSPAEQAAAENMERANRNLIAPPAAGSSADYVFATNATGSLTDMTGSTQLVAAGNDDAASPNTPIGFDFFLMGSRYSQFNATSNGYVGLSATGTTVGSTNYSIANGTVTTPIISACGGDLETAASTGKIHYKLLGSAPNRTLVIQFLNMSIVYNGTTADGTYEVRLHESTGQIELVYGSMARNSATGLDSNSGNLGIGFATAAANSALVSIVSATDTITTTTPFTQQMYTLSSVIPNLNSPSDGSRKTYLLTPPVPTAPTGLGFTGVTPVSMTLNWTDSPDEQAYAIYRSTDGINYTYAGPAAQNAISFTATGLNPSTTYFWNVYALSEGALSATALSGSQATAAPGNITSNGTGGGNWSSTATWSGGVVPTATDAVTILTGDTVNDDASAAFSIEVQNGAVLQFDATTAQTLTVTTSVTIDVGGAFQTASTGTVTTHSLVVGTDLINNGTLNFSTNANTAGARITFTGAANNTFGGTGGTTNIRTMTINKGTSNANVIEMNPSNLTVQGTTTDGTPMAFLTLTNGTLKVSGTYTMTGRVFATAAYTIGPTAGFWLNNPNFTVPAQTGNATATGLFRLTQGTFNVGTAASNSLIISSSTVAGTTIIEGGSLNVAGGLRVNAATNACNYTQTGGTVTVCTVSMATANVGNFDLGTNAASLVTLSGGTVIIQSHATGTGTIDYRYDADPTNLTGTVIQLGNASSGAAKAFNIRGVLPNLVITNTSANHTCTFNNTLVNFYHVVTGNLTINTGNTLDLSGSTTSILTFLEGNILNNGTLNASNANMSVEITGTGLQTYSGTGIMVAPTTDMDIDSGGIDFSGATNQQVIARINLFTGGITGANKITLGNGGATSAFIQIGNGGAPATTTGPVTGTIVNNAGSGGYTIFYGDVDADRSTGGEIPASGIVTNVTFDTQGANITLAGGDLMVTGATTFGDASDTTSNGRAITGANNLIIGSAGTVTRVGGLGHVDGNLVKNFATNTALSFESGTANGYSPVMVNMTAGAPAPFTVKSTQMVQPNIPNPTMALKRYWTLTATGVTADLTFNYLDPTDIPGTANENNFAIFKYNGTLTMPGGSVNTVANTATITGVTSFSDWTLAEPAAPMLSSAVSELTHGGAGTFDINLPLSGTAGVEDRNSSQYNIILTFTNGPTVSGTAAVTAGTATAGTPTFSGSTMTVPLTGVTNAQTVTLAVSNVNGLLPSASVDIGFLIGDTGGDGAVNAADVGQTKSQSGNSITISNFREDVNIDGNLNAGDVGLVKSKSGTALP